MKYESVIDRKVAKQIEEAIKLRKLWQQNKKYYEPLVAGLGFIGIEADITYEFRIVFSGNQKLLEQVQHMLRSNGFSIGNGHTVDQGWYHQAGVPEGCTLQCWINYTNDACTLVKTGEETVTITRPIYKKVCSDTTETTAEITLDETKLLEA